MKRRLIGALWQFAAVAVFAGGVAAFLWMPDSRPFWLALSALLPMLVLLGSLLLQSAAAAAAANRRGRLWFQALIGALLFAAVVLLWRFTGRWYWWALFWLIVPPFLGPAFVAGRWRRPRVSLWFLGAAFIPPLLVRWTPHIAAPAADIAIFVLRFSLAVAILVWCLVLALEDWAASGDSSDSAASVDPRRNPL